ncbi:MAG: hypothetical protein IPL79_04075 [Myxococcales bacterium]|nr:hypothetical protein [Myxococcales bacterium]
MRQSRPNRFNPVFARLAAAGTMALAVLVAGGVPMAVAKPKPKAAVKLGPSAEAQEKALSDFLGPYKFGMTKDEVLAVLRAQLDARYKAESEATQDVYRQDQIQARKKLELDRLGKSYTEFTGTKTGWDVSLIDEEFVHNNNEALLENWENAGGKNQRRFFFFHNGKLYKMVLQIDARQLEEAQRSFEFFVGLIEARLGAATKSSGAAAWKLRAATVAAADELEFYNAFRLAFADAARQADVVAARVAMGVKPKEENRLIKSITAADDDDGPSLDAGKDAVDKLLKGN